MLGRRRERYRVNAIERRIRALQRIAYGADSSDEERARAAAELAELTAPPPEVAPRDAGSESGPPSSPDQGLRADERADAAGATELSGDASASDAESSEGFAGVAADDDSTRRRLIRWAAIAAGIGLVVGVALGWAAGQREPETSTSSSRLFDEANSPDPGMPLDDTALLPLFDRLPLAAEAIRVASIDDSIDEASVRLLASRTDGPSAFLARTVDGSDVCLVLLLPAGPFRRACTAGGIVPIDGLAIQYEAEGYGLAVARLSSAGTVALGLIVQF